MGTHTRWWSHLYADDTMMLIRMSMGNQVRFSKVFKIGGALITFDDEFFLYGNAAAPVTTIAILTPSLPLSVFLSRPPSLFLSPFHSLSPCLSLSPLALSIASSTT